jgi:hypothetical protein
MPVVPVRDSQRLLRIAIARHPEVLLKALRRPPRLADDQPDPGPQAVTARSGIRQQAR